MLAGVRLSYVGSETLVEVSVGLTGARLVRTDTVNKRLLYSLIRDVKKSGHRKVARESIRREDFDSFSTFVFTSYASSWRLCAK